MGIKREKKEKNPLKIEILVDKNIGGKKRSRKKERKGEKGRRVWEKKKIGKRRKKEKRKRTSVNL